MVDDIMKLMTKLFLCFFCFLVTFFSHGQKYSIGAKAAPLMTWSSFGDKEDKETFSGGVNLGYNVGGIVSFPLKHKFDFFAEGGFSQKLRTIKSQNERRINRSTYHFVDLVMLLRKSYPFQLEKNIPGQWFINIGPEVSYWLNGKGTIGIDGPDGLSYEIVFDKEPDSNFKYMYMNNVNRWLFGLCIGAGIKAPLVGNQSITTELRFVSGHTFFGNKDSSHIEILTFEDTMKTNMKALQLVISYTLDFDVQQQRKGKSTLDKKIKNTRNRRR